MVRLTDSVQGLVITIWPRAQIRIIYGYMLDSKLHVHHTRVEQFTQGNYQTMLEATLQWAFAVAHGDCTKVITLPDIAEEDEADPLEVVDDDEDLEEGGVKLYVST